MIGDCENIVKSSNLRLSYNITFLAEVINKALTCKENSDISIFEIISEAAGKRMGLSVNAEQLKSLIKWHKIGLHSSGLCSSCFVPEDIEHVLLYCPRYSIPRNLFRYHLQTIKVDFTLRSILLDISESHLLSFIVSAQLFI